MKIVPIIRLYRFYNWEQSKDGEPFALCDECALHQPVPEGCVIRKIANDALQPCNRCGATQDIP
jgi:hypothetical protein